MSDNWDNGDGKYHMPRPPEGITERRDTSHLEAKMFHLDASQQILKSKVDDHDKVISELKDATKENTKTIEKVSKSLNSLEVSIKEGIRTAKVIAYTGATFFLVNYFGLEAVIKGLTGVGK